MLDSLLAEGIKYVFVSNSDNLGATLDLKLLNHFASTSQPFCMEVAERTESDKKGGHLCKRKSDGAQLILLFRRVLLCVVWCKWFSSQQVTTQNIRAESLWIRERMLLAW